VSSRTAGGALPTSRPFGPAFVTLPGHPPGVAAGRCRETRFRASRPLPAPRATDPRVRSSDLAARLASGSPVRTSRPVPTPGFLLPDDLAAFRLSSPRSHHPRSSGWPRGPPSDRWASPSGVAASRP